MKKLLQVILFLSISWGGIGFGFAMADKLKHDQAMNQIVTILRAPADDPNLTRLCKNLVVTDGFLSMGNTRSAQKSKAICQYHLFNLEN